MQQPNLNPPIKSICKTRDGAKLNKPVYVVETYKNGTEWYRKYSDGVIEQGGYITGLLNLNEEWTFDFVTSFTDPNSVTMHVTAIFTGNYSNYRGGITISSITTDKFTVWSDALTGTAYKTTDAYWEARGI